MYSEKEMWQWINSQYREKYKQEALKNYPHLVKLPPNLHKLMPVDKKIKLLEKFLSKWCSATGTERLIAIDEMGDILVDAIGEEYTVPLLDEEEELIKTFGVVMIHCHSLNYMEGKIDTLSPNDIMLLYKLGIPESRVVFGLNVFVWKRGKKRINKKVVKAKMEEILALLNTKKMTSSEYQEKEIINLSISFGAEYYQKNNQHMNQSNEKRK